MKRIFLLPLIMCLILTISCENRNQKEVSAASCTSSDILLIGLDDAAQNMDVLCFVSYKQSTNEVSFVQIPRDTYFDFGGTQNKINQIYSFYRAYYPQSEAMSRAVKDIADALSVSLDGFIAITTSALCRGIDALGGIDIELQNSVVFTDEFGEKPLSLNQGGNHLNGEECIQFLRYRRGYLTGDLGRLDAQKLFFRGVMDKFSNHLPMDKLLQAFFAVQKDIITDLNIVDLIRISTGDMDTLAQAKVNYLTLPGEAAISARGLSYYVLNRKGASEVCERFLFAEPSSFDKNNKFLCANEISFANIYNDKNNKYQVYDNDTLGGIYIPKKQKS